MIYNDNGEIYTYDSYATLPLFANTVVIACIFYGLFFK